MRVYGQVKGKAHRDEAQAVYVKPKPKYWQKHRERLRSQEVPEGHRLCKRCLKTKPLEEFDKEGVSHKTCNSCRERRGK